MRKLIIFLAMASLTITACSSDGSGPAGPTSPAACSIDGQKTYVLDALYYWYLWNDLLPANINIADYATPEELVTSCYPRPMAHRSRLADRWIASVRSVRCRLTSSSYGEGKYEGFGFSWRVENNEMRFTRVFARQPCKHRRWILARPDSGQYRRQDHRRYSGKRRNQCGAELRYGRVRNPEPRRQAHLRVSVTTDIVTIDPVPQYRIIDMGPGEPPVGYMEFATFISTADGLDAMFNTVFADFIAAGVEDVISRYAL